LHRRKLLRGVAVALASPVLLVLVMALFTPLPAELREPAVPSLRVYAQNDRLLREVRTTDGSRARPLPFAEIPPHVRNAVIAAEDKNFYYHPGVDPVAVLRAAASDVRHLRIVSGASTITMQLARTLRPHRRGAWGKLTETALALRIEASLSKNQILEEYINRVVYGPNLRGYAAASEAYVGTAPSSLSVAQAALIAGLPRGPSLYAVSKRPDLARRRRDRVLGRMAQAGMLTEAERAQAVAEPMTVHLDKPVFGAPHLLRALTQGTLESVQPGVTAAMGNIGQLSRVDTTIDLEVQRAAEGAVSGIMPGLAAKKVSAASVVVIHNQTGDVLAWVGSPDFHNEQALGQNDGVLALRQPGSALKPFVYAEAMRRLGWTGATVLPDLELHIALPGGGDYVPHNYDSKLRGPVRLREALGNSLNVPAVHAIHEVGTQPVLELLRKVGFSSLTQDAEHYGPALALGDGEVRLIELANAYATLARGGEYRPVRVVQSVTRGGAAQALAPVNATRAMPEAIAAMLTDILSDKTARMSAFGDQNALEFEFDVAAKTGTSKGYRDNVAVGFSKDVTVAVWVGNFDGAAMAGVSGITGAGPIFHDVMEAVTAARSGGKVASLSLRDHAERLGLARTQVCAVSGQLAHAACTHKIQEWMPESEREHGAPCAVHQRVRVDLRNGLRAGPECSRNTTEERTFEQWSPPFDTWAARAQRPIVPTEASPNCPSGQDEIAAAGPAGGTGPRVVYPFDGARFVIDPERPSSLQTLGVRVEGDGPKVEVRVDGVPLPRSRSWALVPGEHVISVHGAQASPDQVRFSVR
jgi:penicillin-binding protein 1C